MTEKTVIHTWTQYCYNYPKSTWGLGDLIRGTLFIYDFCKLNHYNLSVNTSLHPIYSFLKHNDTRYNQIIDDNKDNIPFILDHELSSVIHSKLKTNDYIFECSNNHPISLSQDAINFVKTLLEPNESIYAEYQTKLLQFNTKPYQIIHFRLGDNLIYSTSQHALFDKLYNTHIKPYINENNITYVISDCNSFLEYCTQNVSCNALRFSEPKSAHFGQKESHSEHLRNTLLDFYMIQNACYIHSLSVYDWNSGFAYWISKLYNIPYTSHKLIL